MNWIYGTLAGLIAGIAGAMGLGGGSVLLLYLTLFLNTEQLKAQGINLLFFIPIALFSCIIYQKRKVLKIKEIWLIALFGLIGTVLGVLLVQVINAEYIRKIFGAAVLAYGIYMVVSKQKNDECSKP